MPIFSLGRYAPVFEVEPQYGKIRRLRPKLRVAQSPGHMQIAGGHGYSAKILPELECVSLMGSAEQAASVRRTQKHYDAAF